MYKETDRQAPLFGVKNSLGELARRRLERSWAERFVVTVYPVLLEVESLFAHLYGPTGRPNWSVARVLGVCLIQEMNALSDQAALDALTFDARWRYALGFEEGEDSYLSRQALIEFRSRLAKNDPEGELLKEVFYRLTATAYEDLGLSTSKQRVDSTLIRSNIRSLSRYDLLVTTLKQAIQLLHREHKQAYEQLSVSLKEWYEDKEKRGWFGDKGSRLPMAQIGEWLFEVVERCSDDEQLGSLEAIQLVTRAFEENFLMGPDPDPDPDKEPVPQEEQGEEPAPKKEQSEEPAPEGEQGGEPAPKEEQSEESASKEEQGEEPVPDENSKAILLRKHSVKVSHDTTLQSPFDPDAGKGHKGSGYMVQITETCGNESTELITSYDILAGNVPDQNQSQVRLTELESRGMKPKILYADAGYITALALEFASEMSVYLHGPMYKQKNETDYLRIDFEYNEDGTIQVCPEGQKPRKHTMRKYEATEDRFPTALFDPEACNNCEKTCPVYLRENSAALILVDRLLLRDQRLSEQENRDWWLEYKIRSGVEGTVSETKRAHGLGQLRVRKSSRVTIAVSLKMMACNAKRWIKATAKAA